MNQYKLKILFNQYVWNWKHHLISKILTVVYSQKVKKKEQLTNQNDQISLKKAWFQSRKIQLKKKLWFLSTLISVFLMFYAL